MTALEDRSLKEVADRSGVSYNTVKTYARSPVWQWLTSVLC
ncbi:hypothetical protein [Microcoleus sp. K4-C2]